MLRTNHVTKIDHSASKVCMTTPYSSDLAYIHDDGFGGFARQASHGILRSLKEAKIHDGKVVDIGCGSGIWAGILLEQGYEAHGIDLSPDMINLAKENAPGASFEVGSFLDCTIPTCKAVTSMGECLNYLFDKNNTNDRLEVLLSVYMNHYFQGGCLFLT